MMRISTATYRLQFCPGFGFLEAQKILSYLAELGISDLYASPIFKARLGSTHGYDIVDGNLLNPELGTPENYEKLAQQVQALEMGWLQDIVPNHRAYDSTNTLLMDVLEHGQDSEYYHYFDIEWEHPYEQLRGKVLAPMLGDFYGSSLVNGEITLSYDRDGLSVNYYALKYPIRIESYAKFLTTDLGKLTRKLGRSNPDFIKVLGIIYLIKSVSAETSGRQRKDQVEFIKGLLWELYENNAEFQVFIEDNLKTFNGETGKSESFDLLDSLLLEQFYRLSFWKVGAEELNYRRFFTVNELICFRVENKQVFQKSHELIEQLVAAGKVTGLRIDHIDGLYDPTGYLEQLRETMGDVYLVVEKILERDEKLPTYWPIQGTSGYDFLNKLNGIFCQQENHQYFSKLYTNISGYTDNYEQLAAEKKRLIAQTTLVGDIDNIAHLLKKIADHTRYGRDFTLVGLRRAILEVLVQFPVYCTYVNSKEISESDRDYIQLALTKAKQHNPRLLKELNLIEKFLLLDYDNSVSDEEKAQWLHFSMRLQQFSGPLMAKGIEDTLFYVYNRFISLNEVGGYPQTFGVKIEEFHEFNQQQSAFYPHAMNASSTHDTKRSEDVRARLNVLSEIPKQWEKYIKQWQELNRSQKVLDKNREIPDANDEYFFYQNLLGAFPFEESEYPEFIERMKEYMIKSVREAKIHTAWLRPDTVYEEGFTEFVERVLQPNEGNRFLQQVREFQHKIAFYGILNALSQTLLKITAPGIPDFYQGTELWDLSLVDPDNRRPVDYEKRQRFFNEIKQRAKDELAELIEDLKATPTDGKIKLFLIHRTLATRHQYLSLFQQGNYIPLSLVGNHKDRCVAFARSYEGMTCIVVVPRFLTSLVEPNQYPLTEEVWQETYLEIPSHLQSEWKNILTEENLGNQEKLPVGQILQNFPVALLLNRIT